MQQSNNSLDLSFDGGGSGGAYDDDDEVKNENILSERARRPLREYENAATCDCLKLATTYYLKPGKLCVPYIIWYTQVSHHKKYLLNS